jgi:hypothetical protein
VLCGKVLSVSLDTMARDGRHVAESKTHAQGATENG